MWRISDGFGMVVEDVKAANWHQHQVLYGFIKTIMEEAFGDQLETEPAVTTISNAPSPEAVGLPPWVDMRSMKY